MTRVIRCPDPRGGADFGASHFEIGRQSASEKGGLTMPISFIRSAFLILLALPFLSVGEPTGRGDEAQGFADLQNLLRISGDCVPRDGMVKVIGNAYEHDAGGSRIKIIGGEYRKMLGQGGAFLALLPSVEQYANDGTNAIPLSRAEKKLCDGRTLYLYERTVEERAGISSTNSRLAIREYDPAEWFSGAAAFGLPWQAQSILGAPDRWAGVARAIKEISEKNGTAWRITRSDDSGRTAVTAEWQSETGGRGSSQRVELGLDTSRGGLLERYMMEEVFWDPKKKYRASEWAEITEAKEVVPGFWFGTRGRGESKVGTNVVSRWDLSIASVEFVDGGKLLTEEEFVLPAGTQVNDAIRGVKFRTGGAPSVLEAAISEWVKERPQK